MLKIDIVLKSHFMNLSRLKQKVAELPQEAGVYFFYGKRKSTQGGLSENRQLLYIGKATNLRTRVGSYFRTDAKLRNENESTNKNAVDANMRINANQRLVNRQTGDAEDGILKQVQDDKKNKTQDNSIISNVAGRSEWIGRMVGQVEEIKFEQTDSVLEALILESNLIKKHQPKYNTLEKDDKSFAYFVITKEEFPRVLIVRKTDIEKVNSLNNMSLRGCNHPKQSRTMLRSGSPRIFEYKNSRDDSSELKARKLMPKKLQATFGPYTSKQQMQIVLKIIRRIFPFHAGKQKTEKGCLDFQLGTCPGPYADAISKEDYKKNIDGIKLILAGKKKSLLSGLEKEMKTLAKKNEFEKAAQVRNKIFALQHIRDVALITRDMEHGVWSMEHRTQNMEHEAIDTKLNNQINLVKVLSLRGSTLPKQSRTLQGSGSPRIFEYKNSRDDGNELKAKSYDLTPVRIEAYDISNISGTDAVGSMVVFTNSHPDKSQYRKFKIKTVEGSNDVAMMKEVLLRRFSHSLAGLEYQTSSPDGRGAVMKKTLKDDWAMPDLILLDGGAGHVNMAEKLLRQELGLDVAIVGVAKGPTRKNLKLQMANSKQNTIYNIQNTSEIDARNLNDDIRYILQDKLLIKRIMDEAHRFAITFHRKLRGKNALR